MPYWIEQKSGPHKAAIDEAVQLYRDGTNSAQATWGKLAALYRKAQGRTPPTLSPVRNERRNCRGC